MGKPHEEHQLGRLRRKWENDIKEINGDITLLTPWCSILFEKLIVTHRVKRYPAYSMELEVSLPCSQKPATGPSPEPAESIRLIDPYLPKVNIPISKSHVFFSRLGRAKESFQVRSTLKHFVTRSIFTVRGC
jgi:hypothetical protein